MDVLVESGVARYLEFQGLKSARVLSANGLLAVPMTKSEIFQDPVLTLPEKRTLMRFITSMMPFVGSLAFNSPAQLGVDHAMKVQGPNDPAASITEGADFEEPWPRFLQKQKLSPRLQDFVTYAICMWDRSPEAEGHPALSTREGLRCLGRFVSSLGLHGRGTSMPLLYPMYGAAEVAQGFTRMCALHRGTYALRTAVTKLLAERDAVSGAWRVAGVVTHRGEVIRTRSLVASRDFLDLATSVSNQRQSGVGNDQGVAAARASHGGEEIGPGAAGGPPLPKDGSFCARMTVVMDSPLLPDDGLGICVVPPSALEPPLANVVQVLQLDFSTGSCPRGHSVAHLSQVVAPGLTDDRDPFGDLRRVLDALLTLGAGQQHCLLTCVYLHRSREALASDDDGPEGKILHDCCTNHSLALCSDPTVLPQLLAELEVAEARELFLKSAAHGGEALRPEDFLEKPVHVALEEQSSAMEELEAFNAQMQATQRPQQQQDAASSLEAHREGEAEEAVEPRANMPEAHACAASPDGDEALGTAEASTGTLEAHVPEASLAEGAPEPPVSAPSPASAVANVP